MTKPKLDWYNKEQTGMLLSRDVMWGVEVVASNTVAGNSDFFDMQAYLDEFKRGRAFVVNQFLESYYNEPEHAALSRDMAIAQVLGAACDDGEFGFFVPNFSNSYSNNTCSGLMLLSSSNPIVSSDNEARVSKLSRDIGVTICDDLDYSVNYKASAIGDYILGVRLTGDMVYSRHDGYRQLNPDSYVVDSVPHDFLESTHVFLLECDNWDYNLSDRMINVMDKTSDDIDELRAAYYEFDEFHDIWKRTLEANIPEDCRDRVRVVDLSIRPDEGLSDSVSFSRGLENSESYDMDMSIGDGWKDFEKSINTAPYYDDSKKYPVSPDLLPDWKLDDEPGKDDDFEISF